MDKDETERINAQNDVKEQAWSIRKQTDAVLKLTKVVLNNLSEKERELLKKSFIFKCVSALGYSTPYINNW